MYLQKRTAKDIWQNLHELPLIESDRPLSPDDLAKSERFRSLFEGIGDIQIQASVQMKHILSHQVIYASFYRIEIDKELIASPYIMVKSAEIDNYAISRLIEKYFEN